MLQNHDDIRQVVGRFVEHFDEASLNSATGYVAPADKLRTEKINTYAVISK
jgi:hypothetical protein